MSMIPTISEIYYNKNGSIYDKKGDFEFKALSNRANILLIHLEDGYSPDEVTLINFTPNNTNKVYTTHWFSLTPLGLTDYKKPADNTFKTFYSYSIEIPNIVLNNQNKQADITNTITVVKRYGVKSLGYFDKVSDLPEATLELKEENAFGYVTNEDDERLNGIYQVEFTGDYFEWVKKDSVANYGGVQKQYATTNIYIQRGYENPKGFSPISTVITQMIIQSLNSVEANLNRVLSGYIADINFMTSDTIQPIVTEVNDNVYNVWHEVIIDDVNNDLLEQSEFGLYVKRDDGKLDLSALDDYYKKYEVYKKSEVYDKQEVDYLFDTFIIDADAVGFEEITLQDIVDKNEKPKLVSGKTISLIPFDGGIF